MRPEHWLYTIPLRLRSIFRRSRLEQELDEELQFHLEQRIQNEIAAGRPLEEARQIALRAMEGMEQQKEKCRDERRLNTLTHLLQDLKYALRMLRKNPGFTAVAVLTLALGIGATTATFSIVNGILLRPLTYPDSGRIVSIRTNWKEMGRITPRISGGDFIDVQAENRVFAALGIYVGGQIGVQVGNRGEFGAIYLVNPDFLRVFSAAPVYGRLFDESEAGEAALVSLGFAARVFGSGTAALGQTISVEHRSYRITGVLPAAFQFPGKAEVWLARPAQLENLQRSSYSYYVVAKLKPGVSPEAAEAQLDTIATRLAAAFPDTNRGKWFSVTPLREQMTGPVNATLWVLMAAVSLVLLISCANVANLLLARAAHRSREIALRTALGASRWRIIRQLTVESVLLASAAAVLGVMLATGGTAAVLRLAPENLPRLAEVHVDRFVLAFAGGISLLATLLFGLLPAWQTSRVDLQDALKQGGSRGMVGSRPGLLRSVLVVAEISLSVVLAVGATLLFRSFLSLSTAPLGFATEGRLVMYAHIPAQGREEYVRVAASFERLLPEFAAIPGVQSAAAAMGLPTGRYGSNGLYFVEGASIRNPPNAGFLLASPGYFATMGVPLRHGREFTERDRYGAPFVAIVNEALVRRSFPNQDPINQRIKCGLDDPDKWMTIVGVVGDTRQYSPASEPEPLLYMPLAQHPYYANEFQMVLRTALPPVSLVGPVRQKMRERNPTAAVSFTTLEEMVSESIATPRFRVFLTTAFAALALLLAMAGIYGVMSYLTAQRTPEFGLRLALGAGPGDLLAGVLFGAARLALTGLALGTLISLAYGKLIAGMLFGLKPTDAMTYIAVVAGMLIVTLAAAAIPAWRAARIDPVSALREE